MELNDLTYYIPTRGRVERKDSTLQEMDLIDLTHRVVICCPPEEVGHWRDRYHDARVVADPPEVLNDLCLKRAWMFDHCESKYFFMIDDDLSFAVQYDMEPRVTIPVSDAKDQFREDITEHLWELFQEYDTVTWGWREFSHIRPFLLENGHVTRTWGYEKAKVREDLKPAWGRLRFYHDTDWCLTLLEAGHASITSSNLITSARKEAGTPEEGGLGIYRTPEEVAECGRRLLELHPGSISVNSRSNDNPDYAQSGRFRVNWKKFRGENWKKYLESLNG